MTNVKVKNENGTTTEFVLLADDPNKVGADNIEAICVVCDAGEDLIIQKLMTGGDPEKPVCERCHQAWYETGIVNRDQLRAYVLKKTGAQRRIGHES